MPPTCLQDWLTQASMRLAARYGQREPAPMERAQQELLWLLEGRLGISRTTTMMTPERPLSPDQKILLEQSVIRLEMGEPLAYVLGEQPFWTLNLQVSKHTLIPRAATECLVETALALDLSKDAEVLDLGTGTGAIALALASERPAWRILGTDLVPEAVELAVKNAQRHQLNHVHFVQSHWYEQLKPSPFDLICSNPPYIESGDPDLDPQVFAFEPTSALIADKGGLADIDIITSQAPGFLKDGGYLLVEHGWRQALSVRTLFQKAGFSKVQTIKDTCGQDRVTWGIWLTPRRR